MPHQPKPLMLLVSDELAKSEPVRELVAKGHTVLSFEAFQAGWESGEWEEIRMQDVDLILGPNCQLMTPDHLPYLDEAVKRARKLKYPPKPKEASQ